MMGIFVVVAVYFLSFLFTVKNVSHENVFRRLEILLLRKGYSSGSFTFVERK